jgi:hypothetical protein
LTSALREREVAMLATREETLEDIIVYYYSQRGQDRVGTNEIINKIFGLQGEFLGRRQVR